MLTWPVAQAAAQLVHQDSPISHDQLEQLFAGAGLAGADPGPGQGKAKRMRAVMDYAMARDRKAGALLVYRLVCSIRGHGGFREGDAAHIGEARYLNLRDAYRASNFELDRDGELRPRLLDAAPPLESDEVLRAYVRRIQQGATDAPLVTGTGKDLLDATARRVLEVQGGTYRGHDFPGTLFHAFCAAGLPTPPSSAIEMLTRDLSNDPRDRFKQVLYLLDCALNQLRNDQGTGHGRAFAPTVSDLEATVAAKGMALISELLLVAQPTPGTAKSSQT
ncbi:MAG: hypothetical protein QOI48_3267 [Solirubrobacteraceae bacterium]|jgi:hypothetical protein|nr:hypothetical protein [Solirubrobacteraceae bacterium]